MKQLTEAQQHLVNSYLSLCEARKLGVNVSLGRLLEELFSILQKETGLSGPDLYKLLSEQHEL